MSPLRLAHRGDWRAAPENSIAALGAASRIAGCDGVEFDVRASSDGVPVVIHDQTLERIQGVAGRVDAMAANRLAGHGVPSLADVCSSLGPAPFLDVELKEWVPASIEILESARGHALDRAVVSSFHRDVLLSVGRARPAWPRWLNAFRLDAGAIGLAVELGCAGIGAEWHSIGRRAIADAVRAGLQVAAWTVRRRPTYARLERLGVYAICVEAAALDG